MRNELNITQDRQIEPIYNSMREGSLRIEIEQVQVIMGSKPSVSILIPAWISVENDQLYLNLRGTPKQADYEEAISHFSRLKGEGVKVKASDYFQVRAKTEQGIPITLEGVSPVIGRGNFTNSDVGGSRSHERIKFSRISFPAADKADILRAYGCLISAIYRVMACKMGFTENMPESVFGSKSASRPEKSMWTSKCFFLKFQRVEQCKNNFITCIYFLYGVRRKSHSGHCFFGIAPDESCCSKEALDYSPEGTSF